jgi:hypothetical protein
MFALKDRALPYVRAGLPAAYALGASEDAAWGLALARANGCTDEIKRTDALAKLAPSQSKALQTNCAEHAVKVEQVIASHAPAASINSVAETAWRAYSQARGTILESDQIARLSAVIEHDGMSMGQAH